MNDNFERRREFYKHFFCLVDYFNVCILLTKPHKGMKTSPIKASEIEKYSGYIFSVHLWNIESNLAHYRKSAIRADFSVPLKKGIIDIDKFSNKKLSKIKVTEICKTILQKRWEIKHKNDHGYLDRYLNIEIGNEIFESLIFYPFQDLNIQENIECIKFALPIQIGYYLFSIEKLIHIYFQDIHNTNNKRKYELLDRFYNFINKINFVQQYLKLVSNFNLDLYMDRNTCIPKVFLNLISSYITIFDQFLPNSAELEEIVIQRLLIL